MIFRKRLEILINIFFYTDTGPIRFLSWVKARPGPHNHYSHKNYGNFENIAKIKKNIDEASLERMQKY